MQRLISALPRHDSKQSEKQRKNNIGVPPSAEIVTAKPVKGLCYACKEQEPLCIFFSVMCILIAVSYKEKHDRRTEKGCVYYDIKPHRQRINRFDVPVFILYRPTHKMSPEHDENSETFHHITVENFVSAISVVHYKLCFSSLYSDVRICVLPVLFRSAVPELYSELRAMMQTAETQSAALLDPYRLAVTHLYGFHRTLRSAQATAAAAVLYL